MCRKRCYPGMHHAPNGQVCFSEYPDEKGRRQHHERHTEGDTIRFCQAGTGSLYTAASQLFVVSP